MSAPSPMLGSHSGRSRLRKALLFLAIAWSIGGALRLLRDASANNWRSTLEAFLDRSEAVLMDLRGFTQANSGCVFELSKLVERDRLNHTVFVVDGQTDLVLLRSSLGQASDGRGNASTAEMPSLNLVHADRHSPEVLATTLAKLRQLADPITRATRTDGRAARFPVAT